MSVVFPQEIHHALYRLLAGHSQQRKPRLRSGSAARTEQWQPNFLSWWNEMGPIGAMAHHIYLRTATSASFGLGAIRLRENA